MRKGGTGIQGQGRAQARHRGGGTLPSVLIGGGMAVGPVRKRGGWPE